MQTRVCKQVGGWVIQQKKSEVTRERIAKAARQVFAEQGFERATIRSIAERSSIHASMVMRYFSSKEALFASVVQFDLRLPDLRQISPGARGSVLVAHFLDRWDEDGELAALMRAAVSHPAAKARMAVIFDKQLVAAISETPDASDASERAALIASQMLGLGLTRHLLGFESCQALSRETIIARLGPTIQRYLEGY